MSMLFEVDNQYFFQGPYFFRHLPIKHGFKYNRKAEAWEAPDKSAWLSLKAQLDTIGDVPPEEEKKRRIALSRATDTEYQPPCPSGHSYLPYQRAGIEYAVEQPGTLIADPMGLGKTIQAIGVANATKARKILVIAPTSLCINWQKEMQEWLIDKYLSIAVVDSKGAFLNANVVIMSYNRAGSYSDRIRQIDWDMLIVDECHYIKGNSQRAYFIVGGKVKGKIHTPIQAKRKLMLTGTPILNKPSDIWNVAHYLAPEIFHDQYAFWQRYCGLTAGFGGSLKHDGATNLEELQELLRSTIMIRRDKSEVLKDLPPKTRQVIEVKPTADLARFVANEMAALTEAKAQTALLKSAVENAHLSGDMNAYKDAVTKLKIGVSLHISEISRVRKETAIAKAPMMIDHVRDLLEDVDKIVMFAHHKEVISMFMEAFRGKAVRVTGSDNKDERNRSVERFQKDPKIKLFIGSITAAGVGLTLTASSTVVFAELDWVPANIMQCEDRCHRIGQKDNVLVQHFVVEGSLDANMARKLVEKQNIADRSLDVIDLNEKIKLD